MKALARWSAKNPVAANVMMLLIFFGGYLAVTSMRREMFPEFVLDFVTVSVPYPGASPEEIEESICIKIEERIESVDGVKKILASASENVGMVTAELEVDADKVQAYNDIKNEIEQIFTFPVEAEEPIISTFVIRDPAIFIAIYGDASEEALRQIAADARDELTASPEISLASMVGARDYEISIEVSEEALRNYGLSFDAVSNAVSRGSVDLPAGQVKTAEGDVLVRAKGQRYTGREYEEIPLTALPGGAIVRLGDVANVVDGFKDEDIFARYDGQPAIIIQVFKVGAQDVLDVVEAAKRFVEEKRGQLPDGVEIDTYYDFSVLIRDRINLLVKNGLFGLALVFIVLWLFLRLRLAFWVGMGIPISFMGAFCLLGFQGETINMISLFAFIMTLGIVVDDAIIVGENIFTLYSRGASATEAAIEGSGEVAWPVTNSIMTTIVAFCPMFFVTGIMGKFIGIMPTAVIAVLIISLFEAFLILPSHLQHSLANEEKRKGREAKQNRIREWLDRQIQHHIEAFYTPFLQLALRYRYLTVALAIAAVIVSVGLVVGGRIGFVIFPKMYM